MKDFIFAPPRQCLGGAKCICGDLFMKFLTQNMEIKYILSYNILCPDKNNYKNLSPFS